MNYALLDTMPEEHPKLCILNGAPKKAEALVHHIMVGEPVLADFPEDAAFHMSGRQDRIGLGGLIGNTDSLLIVHRSIKDLVLAHDKRHDLLECLPVKIINHKKRVASADYFILNPLGGEDCLDPKKSVIERNKLGEIVEVEEIVLKKSKLDPRRALFRPLEDPYVYIAREDWLLKVKELGLKISNIYATPLDVSA
jgi:hypothetical protein